MMFWTWLYGWRERRAEAAVRRQLAALEHERRLALLVEMGGPESTLLEECDRADALAGRHGGFVSTTRVRQLLGGSDG